MFGDFIGGTRRWSDKKNEQTIGQNIGKEIGQQNRTKKSGREKKHPHKENWQKIGEQHRTEKSDKQAADEKTKENLKVCLITTTVLPNTYP